MKAISLYEWIPKHLWDPIQTQKNARKGPKSLKWEKRENVNKKISVPPQPENELNVDQIG